LDWTRVQLESQEYSRLSNPKLEAQDLTMLFEGDGLDLQGYNFSIGLKQELRNLAFIVRAPHYSNGRIQRIKRWISEFNSTLDDQVDVWIASDVSNSDWAITKISEDLDSDFPGHFQVFTYTVDHLIERFPNVKEVPMKEGQSYGWLIPLLHLQVWWTHVNRSYHHVWAIEDDTDRCGSIAELVSFYEDDPQFADSDLISDELVKRDHNWPHFRESNSKFDALIGDEERYFSHEHFQRYSHRFLNQLLKSGLQGIHAQSEMFTPSFCKKLSSANLCKFEPLKQEHIGDKYGWNDRLSEDKLSTKCNSPEGNGRLFHAMKW
jgi:hypothetical protein